MYVKIIIIPRKQCVISFPIFISLVGEQREKKEREEWEQIEEMSEGEYDALSTEERQRIDKMRLSAKKERLSKKRAIKEAEERERRKERELLEEKRLEDEK